MIELWLTRHGQTEDNITRTLAGHMPGKLTPSGVNQAIATGKFLANQIFDFAYVSDLGRTQATYKCIMDQVKNKIPPERVTFTPIMREKGGGEYEGKPLELFRKTAADKKIPLRQFKGKGGESWEDVNQRAQAFIRMLVVNHLGEYSLKGQQLKKNNQDDSAIEEERKHVDEEPLKLIKILGITHGGYIMEVHNIIEYIQSKKEPVLNNVAKNCSIHKIQIKLKPGTTVDDPQKLTLNDILIECIDRNNDDHCKNVK